VQACQIGPCVCGLFLRALPTSFRGRLRGPDIRRACRPPTPRTALTSRSAAEAPSAAATRLAISCSMPRPLCSRPSASPCSASQCRALVLEREQAWQEVGGAGACGPARHALRGCSVVPSCRRVAPRPAGLACLPIVMLKLLCSYISHFFYSRGFLAESFALFCSLLHSQCQSGRHVMIMLLQNLASHPVLLRRRGPSGVRQDMPRDLPLSFCKR